MKEADRHGVTEIQAMGRARNLKPSFFSSEQLAEVSAEARLLYIGLWTMADRRGYLHDRPKRIKAELFPYDGYPVEVLLNDLASHDLIIRFDADDKHYIFIPTFTKHQKPHPNERENDVPEFKSDEFVKKHENTSCARKVFHTKVLKTSFAQERKSGGMMNDECGMRNEEQGRMKDEVTATPVAGSKISESDSDAVYPEQFQRFWKVYPAKRGRKVGKKETFDLWKRIPACDRDSTIAAAENYAASPEATREDGKYIRDPERFIKKDWWRDWLVPAESNLPPLIAPDDFNYLEWQANYLAQGGK